MQKECHLGISGRYISGCHVLYLCVFEVVLLKLQKPANVALVYLRTFIHLQEEDEQEEKEEEEEPPEDQEDEQKVRLLTACHPEYMRDLKQGPVSRWF